MCTHTNKAGGWGNDRIGQLWEVAGRSAAGFLPVVTGYEEQSAGDEAIDNGRECRLIVICLLYSLDHTLYI